MFFENVVNELLKVKEININEKFSRNEIEFFNYFIEFSKNAKSIYKRNLVTFRKFAKMLDVPIGFIFRILILERIEEYEKRFETD